MRKTINRLKRINWLLFIQKVLINLIALTILAAALDLLTYKIISNSYNDNKFDFDEIENIESDKYQAAIVFGAGLNGNLQSPSDVLKDRISTGVELYKKGKVKKIIMSGDNRFDYYDEPTVMIEYAKSLGVPEQDLQPDYAGRRTYDTCYRAKEIFSLDKAILVTQDYHLTRAMYICDNIGVEPIGVRSDLNSYPNMNAWKIRENLAFMLALWEVNIDHPDNVVLGEKIDLE